MNQTRLMMAGLLLGGMTLAGCMKDKNPDPVADVAKPLSATKPVEAAKVMTHYLTADQPCYQAPSAKSCGTLKKGTKVLLLIPGSMAQIETADGKILYTKLDAIESIEAPAPPKSATKPVVMAAKLAATKPAELAKAAAPAKDMTHMLTVDQPYFMARPMSADVKPAGTLPKGTKVLLLIPGSYCQVETADGKTLFTKIDGVDLIPAK